MLDCPSTITTEGGGGGRPLRRNNSNESFSSLSLAIKAMTRFGPSSYGNLQVRRASLLDHHNSSVHTAFLNNQQAQCAANIVGWLLPMPKAG